MAVKVIVILSADILNRQTLITQLTGILPAESMPPSFSVFSQSNQRSFCTKQQLLYPHLTPNEQLILWANIHGINAKEVLAKWGSHISTRQSDKKQIKALSRSDIRLLSFIMALIPQPDWILVDDLADGLSLTAKSNLWQTMRELACSTRCSHILYLTDDLDAARNFANEIWFMDKGEIVAKWLSESFLSMMGNMAQFQFNFQTSQAASRFHSDLIKNPTSFSLVENSEPICRGRMVIVFVRTTRSLLDLYIAGGSALINVHSRSISTQHLPTGWYDPILLIADSTLNIDLSQSVLEKQRYWRKVWVLTLLEYRRHVRGFLFQWANWLMSWFYQFLMVLLIWGSEVSPAQIAAFLSFSAGLAVPLSWEAFSQLWQMADMPSSFDVSAKRTGKERPFFLLAFYEMNNLSRTPLLIASIQAVSVLLLTHSIPTLSLWFIRFGLSELAILGLGFWLMAVFLSLLLGIGLSLVVPRTRLEPWFGLSIQIGIFFGTYFLPSTNPLSWLWPFTALQESLKRLWFGESPQVPLLIVLIVTVLLGGCVIGALWKRPSIQIYD